MNLNDAILAATGGPTVNDGMASFFSKTATENLNDAQRRWLEAKPTVTPGKPLNDMWHEYLRKYSTMPAHIRQLNDMKLYFWIDRIIP